MQALRLTIYSSAAATSSVISCRSFGPCARRRPSAVMNASYRSADLASGSQIVFAATGVTDGTLMKGVRFFGDGARTSSLVMQTNPQRIQFIDTIHVTGGTDVKVRF